MFDVRLSTALTATSTPIEIMRLGKAIRSGSFTKVLPGGFGVLQVELAPGWRQPQQQNCHVEVFETGGGLVWEGRLLRPSLAGRDVVSLEAHGYGLTATDDQPITGYANDTALHDASDCLQVALGFNRILKIGATWQATGVLYPLGHFDGRSAWAVQDEIGQATGFDFAVWEGRRASWSARIVPATADYLVAEDDVPHWTADSGDLWTGVILSYTDETTGQPEQIGPIRGPDAEAIAGISRIKALSIGTTTLAGAAATAKTFLAQHSAAVVRADLGPQASLRTPLGARVPGHDVRPGQWVEVQNRGKAMIVQTSCDWFGAVACQLGQPARGDNAVLAAVTQNLARIRAGGNPVTGAPA